MGRLTNKQRELKKSMGALLFLIFRESGHCEYFEPSEHPESTRRSIGGIAMDMIDNLAEAEQEDVRRAYDSLTRAKR